MKVVNSQFTKIVATVGPASSSYEALEGLIQAGVDIFRLNFSHGTHDQHQQTIDNIVKLNEAHNLHVGILADLQGPKIRVGKIEKEGLAIEKGDILTFSNEETIGTKKNIYLSYQNFASDVSEGDKVLVDDGKIALQVVSTDKVSVVKLKVLFGGILKSNKGVNLPDTEISMPSITKKDKSDLKYILTQPVNWIALSFVRSSTEMHILRDIVETANHKALLIAKIEKPQAVKNLKEIIKASDAIMVARGDLGIEVPIQKIPGIQKNIIKKCIQKAKPVIVATQMMDSMITNLYPTRAEVTDVANAVLDGADAVMLSGETSVGVHPIRVVQEMNKIITEAEKNYSILAKRPKPDTKSETYLSDVVCFNAAKMGEEIKAKGIASITVSGYTAFKISSYRAKIPLYIFSSAKQILGTLNLVWGVRTFLYDKFTTTDETIEDIQDILKESNKVKADDFIINTGSMPLQKRFRTNMMKVTIIE